MEFKELAHNKIVILLLGIIVLLIIGNLFTINYYQNKYSPKFTHISPSIAWMDVGEFLEVQSQYFVQFNPLKVQVKQYLNKSSLRGTYGVYFEDLNTGAWIGINEKDSFISASLLKVPIMVAILKKVEKGDLKLEQRVFLHEEDLNSRSGTLATKGAGYSLTVKELLVYMIKESDNTALAALHRSFLSDMDIFEARLAMGLPVEGERGLAMGPKDYSSILRALYYSAYLRRAFSEIALSIMSETDYNSQLPAGIPKDVPISHKVGFVHGDDNSVIYYHDCGIIYHPNKPYILCIMSKNANATEVDSTMSNISRIVYEYVDSI